MRLRLMWLGETRDPHLRKLEDRYFKRLQRFTASERVSVKELRKDDPHQRDTQLEREAALIEKALHKGTYLVVLSERGRQLTSQELAGQIEALMNQGQPEMTFVVGGFWGLPRRVVDSAQLQWSLSALTFPHELARTMVLEQLYRAMTIIRGLPYHK